eukprot:CAMPEP_0174305486 /NCGR_PEP_ID=MMETSP0809-20121228/61442_1 /TAXON_ID=73025 ORGANISM="Eutreptiella gymnastica-like, Strain CCMP1594" /NCGR_SAMPLE_ID=MMETSP0809 /ASSEMBLY_ACC=CAM_ASM_000658 /LENGTH=99 /DNA_ID=CAMNT_0015411975 /DNA_START=228 /DNA_END=527 /DNA_ORIENTATION=-
MSDHGRVWGCHCQTAGEDLPQGGRTGPIQLVAQGRVAELVQRCALSGTGGKQGATLLPHKRKAAQIGAQRGGGQRRLVELGTSAKVHAVMAARKHRIPV